MKQFKNFTLHMLAGANCVNVLLMWAVGYSAHINPSAHRFIGIAGLSFPVFLAVNVAFMLFWLCVRKRWAAISLVGLAVAYSPVRAYWPLNLYKPVPEGCFKVLAYNTMSWGNWSPDNPSPAVAEYIVRQNADVVCLEEANATPWCRERIDSILGPLYAYRDTALSSSRADDIMLLSKYPIIRKEKIQYVSKTNHSAAFWLRRGQDTLIVVANHLQSTSLSKEERSRFRSMMHGKVNDGDSARIESHALYTKLGDATAQRAPQVEAIVRYVQRHRRYPVIVCGDFNDSPVSYTRHRLASVLNDCYVESGNGPGISYHYNAFYVRIDHMFCSDHLLPYGCKIDNSITASDHYPIVCWLKRR